MKNLFLIGYRCTGKSTVAQLLGAHWGWEGIDLDVLLETRFGRTIQQIFAREGEVGFRERESALLAEICQSSGQVVATGGGVILRPENRALLCVAGRVVWLQADPQTLWQRLREDVHTSQRRPTLTVGGLSEIEDLLAQRQPLYAECADWSVDTAGRSPEEVAEIIDQRLQGESDQRK